MSKYLNIEDQRYRYHVRECVNGFALQVLVVSSGENVPLSPQTAASLGLQLPDAYRIQSCTREGAEEMLAQVAALNNLTLIE